MSSITREEYLNIRNKLLLNNVDEKTMTKLKLLYANEVNSTRQLSVINTLGDLIELLEKRASVSENDTTILGEIQEEVSNQRTAEACNPININSVHGQNNDTITTRMEKRGYGFAGRNLNDTVDVNSKVHEIIALKIGNKWTDFARALDLPESEIDNYKFLYRDKFQKCVQSVLLYHKTNAVPREWKIQLLNALTVARRNDLRNNVEKIFENFS